jgi:hypothetical protein
VIDQVDVEELFPQIPSGDEQGADLRRIGLSGLEQSVDLGLDLGDRLLEGLFLVAVDPVDLVPLGEASAIGGVSSSGPCASTGLTNAIAIRNTRIRFITLSLR